MIDANTNSVITTIALSGKPEFEVSDNNGKIYVNIEDKNLISVINTSDLKVEKSWSISPGEEPSGLAIDNTTHRLFSFCDNKKMVVVDALSGKIIATSLIGERVDGCAFDTESKRVFSSNGEGTVTVIQEESPAKFSVLENIPTQKGARTICIDNKTHHLYLPTAEYGEAPAPDAAHPHPRPSIKPGTFIILDIVEQQ